MEVLIAIFVMAIGILGLAALLPVGQMSVSQTIRADRAGACGRAALHHVKACNMLDSQTWNAANTMGTAKSFVIDPLGRINGVTAAFGTLIPRIGLTAFEASRTLCEQVFLGQDDLIVSLPEEMSPPQQGGRSRLMQSGSTTGTAMLARGDYSWFVSVAFGNPNQTLANQKSFLVSVVVCQRRDYPAGGSASSEKVVRVRSFDDGGIGGGGVALTAALNDAQFQVRTNDWVALCSSQTRLCRWYRVVSIDDTATRLTLAGPDWKPSTDYVVAVGQRVVGVYTMPIDMNSDLTWGQ